MGIENSVDITTQDAQILCALLGKYLSETTVWAFGSRVKGTSRPESDLDLVAFIDAEQKSRLYDLREAFAESNLSFRVDILNWDEIPESFQENIRKEYVEIQ